MSKLHHIKNHMDQILTGKLDRPLVTQTHSPVPFSQLRCVFSIFEKGIENRVDMFFIVCDSIVMEKTNNGNN